MRDKILFLSPFCKKVNLEKGSTIFSMIMNYVDEVAPAKKKTYWCARAC